MFSKWIRFLLKIFDICGFSTEIQHLQNNSKGIGKICLLHIFWASVTTIFVITLLIRTKTYSDVLPYMVNTTVQNIFGLLSYWVIIMESFTQRKIQRKFWHLYRCIHIDRKSSHRELCFRTYSIKLVVFFISITSIEFYLLHSIGFVFRLVFFILYNLIHVRIFYYLFYLELIKHELMMIENSLKVFTLMDDFKLGFKKNGNQIPHGSNERLSAPKQMKTVYKHYSQICTLNDCINEIFGWSSFVTILYCIQHPLTDANWAYSSFAHQPMEYICGN